MGKKRKGTQQDAIANTDALVLEVSLPSTASTSNTTETKKTPSGTLPFKNPNYQSSKTNPSSSKKSRGWKSLKQIMSSEKPQIGTGVIYAALDAPPSKKPVQKFSDLSGLPAKYRDPASKLFYFNCDEYAQIKILTPDIVNGYLELRKDNP